MTKSTDVLMSNMTLAACLAIVESARKPAGTPLFVTLSGSGEYVTFPLPESSVPLTGSDRLQLRRSGDTCELYMDGHRACALELSKDRVVGPLTIHVSRNKEDAESRGRALKQRIRSL